MLYEFNFTNFYFKFTLIFYKDYSHTGGNLNKKRGKKSSDTERASSTGCSAANVKTLKQTYTKLWRKKTLYDI